MAIALSKLVFSTLIATGVAVCSIAAPAHAKNGNGNGNGNNNQTTTNTSSGDSGESTSGIACDISNVSLGGIFATSCEGPFSGNDTGNGNPLLTSLNNGLFDVGSGTTWSQFGKSDSGDFDAESNSTGEWSLEEALTSNTFVISLKASTSYSAYLFDDFDFSKEGALVGLYDTIGVAQNGQGKAKDLSHASIFIANKPTKPVKTRVPEPASIIGLGLVTGGMFVKRRRKSNLTIKIAK